MDAPGERIGLSVHGPAGALDLMVPRGATGWDVAREYAARAGSVTIPLVYTRTGQPLPPDRSVAEAGLVPGEVLVASESAYRGGGQDRRRRATRRLAGESDAQAASATAVAVIAAGAAAAAMLAGWLAAHQGATWSSAAVRVLLAAAVLGLVPGGRFAAARALAAPAFAGAAVFAVLYEPVSGPISGALPALVAATAAASAATAGVARAIADRGEEGLGVWIAAGAGVFAVTGSAAWLDWPPALAWSLLIVLGMLAARFVPLWALRVPDAHVLDVERLALNAWSARSVPPRPRQSAVVPRTLVTDAARRAARVVNAAAVGVSAWVALGSWLLLGSVVDPVDRFGAHCLVFLAGGSLLLAARSHRHVPARRALRLGGLAAWVLLAIDLLAAVPGERLIVLFAVCGVGSVVLVIAGVATGRGWRSPRWSRRADIAELICGSGALAAVLVASGMFQAVVEWTSRNAA